MSGAAFISSPHFGGVAIPPSLVWCCVFLLLLFVFECFFGVWWCFYFFCIILLVLLCFFWCCYFVFFFSVVLLCTLSPCALLLLGDRTFLWCDGAFSSCVEVKLPPLLLVEDITSPSSVCWVMLSSSLVLQHVVTHLFFVSPSHFFFFLRPCRSVRPASSSNRISSLEKKSNFKQVVA